MRVNRMTPRRFVDAPGLAEPAALALWRGLRAAVVPIRGGIVGAGQASGYEIINGITPAVQGGVSLRGEANGVALGHAGTALGFSTIATIIAKMMPNAAPLSVFAFLVRRDSSATIQTLCGNGALSLNGWSFQLNYGSGQIGFTRWGLGDTVSTTLGAVPNTGGQASGVGLVYDGSNVRFFLNGVFQTVASGGINVPSSSGAGYQVGANSNGLTALVNTSIHVLYTWNRVLRDAELQVLWRDPWLPIRPADAFFVGAGAPPAAPRPRSFVAGFIG